MDFRDHGKSEYCSNADIGVDGDWGVFKSASIKWVEKATVKGMGMKGGRSKMPMVMKIMKKLDSKMKNIGD